MAWDFEPLRESLVFLTTQYLTGLELQKPRCDEENYEIPEIAQIDELQTFVGSKKTIWVWTVVNTKLPGILKFVIGDRSLLN
ncbi:hypothetical protein N39L_52420 [Limnospira platensis NIES-39]|nr:hypothetical protein N39L_32790 [Arthrospira platensis NIES-39]BDT14605.1 hypothetical protein N39L_43280 [Arthrospira platensis NIES-39]BDT14917.1 hypothetical protein N39L_46400 [Arthrospira platensis NIES-39]BDT15519.1 hypothetical protein N39L_52420 [Arthrospira platensis NIES-39]